MRYDKEEEAPIVIYRNRIVADPRMVSGADFDLTRDEFGGFWDRALADAECLRLNNSIVGEDNTAFEGYEGPYYVQDFRR